MLHELGRRYVQTGLLQNADDIFWMTQDEVQAAAEKNLGRTGGIPSRKAEWRAANHASPPRALPQSRLIGNMARRKKSDSGDSLKGVAASPGLVTGKACVLHGPEDFKQMQTGDVLVAKITTPAWTPLFVRASALVTDIGGPLSHGSIVAREYGIPAVLGTGKATSRIRSGDIVTVDGYKGLVTLENNQTTIPSTHTPQTGNHLRVDGCLEVIEI